MIKLNNGSSSLAVRLLLSLSAFLILVGVLLPAAGVALPTPLQTFQGTLQLSGSSEVLYGEVATFSVYSYYLTDFTWFLDEYYNQVYYENGGVYQSTYQTSPTLAVGTHSIFVTNSYGDYSNVVTFTVKDPSSPSSTVQPVNTQKVYFTESGLPTGTKWSVQLGTEVKSSTSNRITFEVVGGTYQYVVYVLKGYVPSENVGAVNVFGQDADVWVTFTEQASVTAQPVPKPTINFPTIQINQSKTWLNYFTFLGVALACVALLLRSKSLINLRGKKP